MTNKDFIQEALAKFREELINVPLYPPEESEVKKYKERIESFLSAHLTLAYEAGEKMAEKAFGGCKNCYGKGYATTIEYARGRGEFDMGTGDVVVNEKLPEMRFCSCGRGKELEKRFNEVYEAGKKEKITPEQIEAFQATNRISYSQGRADKAREIGEWCDALKKTCDNRICQDPTCILRSYNTALADLKTKLEEKA